VRIAESRVIEWSGVSASAWADNAWTEGMLFLLTLIAATFASQVPLQMSDTSPKAEFALREGPNILSPKDMLELPRPQPAVANPDGDLALIAVAKYSFADKK
jgi:hypothetical protein